ncbi:MULTISPECIES: DUF3060 domain-containing protein [Sphingomonas]|uniref:DUF3060 domain-containing protein n=1 Tax=Sphingomonas adhaesiva TaxID=28212 RepID=A0A2A4IA90_9SPHN|nr:MULTISPECIES: DUF3060 domain-containing protein [Sphingomonas]PCG14702.1 DUF3060 domain-containing protein [Sphingomonas adhaesiva]PZU81673.1 MAG: DUF3060 domain-containing protein [Sphingomonas sp.]
MRAIIGLSALAASAMLATGGTAAAQAVHEGAGAEMPMTCEDGEAHITGASNRITVEGPCRLLVIEGASNIVTVDLTADAAIRVTGASNRVTWRAPGNARPRISSTGAGNVIRRMR